MNDSEKIESAQQKKNEIGDDDADANGSDAEGKNVKLKGGRLAAIAMAAIGTIYGDIGTSPIYALKECFLPSRGLELNETEMLGVLSLFVWSLLLVVTVKYVVFILRADNKGEGGILALMALALRKTDAAWPKGAIAVAGVVGASLFLGDAIITPAISVLSAVEGLAVVAPDMAESSVPIAIGIIACLFLIQRHGAQKIGGAFGPIMTTWFLTIGLLGILSIIEHPHILAAFQPTHAIEFLSRHGSASLLVLGAVVLCITGGEALYVDLGAFGRPAIRLTWTLFVLPCLLLNYLGQGASMLALADDPDARALPFFHMAPEWAAIPLIILATAATVIASQAVITGAFSLAHQADLLGFLPRLTTLHTSMEEKGHIYLPKVNWALGAAVILAILFFKTSDALASAYGLAVTGEMAVTSLLAYVVARTSWNWRRPIATLFVATFLGIDLSFLSACLVKFLDGGWFPAAVAVVLCSMMLTWKKGRAILLRKLGESALDQEPFIAREISKKPHRVKGTAIYLARRSDGIPHAFLHNLKHNKSLHERIVFLTVRYADIPAVSRKRQIETTELGHGFHRVILNFGFMEIPDVPRTMKRVTMGPKPLDPMDSSYFVGRETLLPATKSELGWWQRPIFAFMGGWASSGAEFFHIPPNRAIEIGTQIEI